VSVAELRRIGAARFPGWSEFPPLWTLVVAGSFCGYFALLVYCDLVRPVNPGFRAKATAPHAVVLTEVRPGTPAAEAGLIVGDHLIAVNGLTIVNSDSWGAIGANYEIDVPMPVIVERLGTRLTMPLRLPRQTVGYWLDRPGATLLLMRLAQLVCLLAGIVVAFRRQRDTGALAASWLLMTCAVFLIALPPRLAIIWRELPIPIRELFWIAHASSITFGPILLTFVTLFPRRLPWAGYIQAAVWGLAGAAMALPLYNAFQLVYNGVELRTIGPRSLPLLVVSSVSLVAAVFLILVNYRRIDDLNERRRLRVVVAGITIAVLPGFSALGYFWLTGGTNQASGIFGSPWMAIVAVALLAAPLSITYAVLRHRLFDLSFTVRNRIRHRCARWFVNSIGEILFVIIVLETLRLHVHTVDWILEQHRLLFPTMAAAAIVIFVNRRRWLKAIDRRYFRERYYAYDVLRNVAEEVHRADSLDRIAPAVVAKIESAMHPEFAALLVYDSSARVFRSIAAAPSVDAPPDLRDDSKLVALARILEEPLDTSKDSGQALLRQLTAADREYVERARIDVLIRVITRDGDLHAFLALGPKRSEEPYDEEEYGLLVTIAENLAMLAARSAPARETPDLEECPECGACFDAGTRVCTTHSRPLTARALPRTLIGRYRLDRRLAAGGMGAVYEGFDLALDRDVAVKVVREHLTASDGARERFIEEAKHGARLRDHPNIVTVHDLGLIAERQPFLVMELLSGGTLRHFLESNGRLDPDLALLILEGVCSAVTEAHRHKLIHRDIKPENIFLVENGRQVVPKVLDFGIAKPLSVATTIDGRRETGSRILLGTLEYMSPEQRRGQAPSKSWDIWSLSVVALEMLSGRPPVSALLPDLGPWQPGTVLRGTLPAAVDVFNRALAIDPAERPADAETLYREIAAACR
jgi:Protein kinase domain/PDZ domain